MRRYRRTKHPLCQPKNCCSGPKTGLLARKPARRSDSSVADGRSPGSRVIALVAAFPVLPSGFRPWLVAYSCGDSRGFGILSRTAFPLGPSRCGQGTVYSGFRLLRAAVSTHGYDMAMSAKGCPKSPAGVTSMRSRPSQPCICFNSSKSCAAVSGGALGSA